MIIVTKILKTRIWANAQRDNRLAEHKWCPVQRRRVWLMPTTWLLCSNDAKMQNQLKLAGVSQTNKTISAASGPKFTILRGHVGKILQLNKQVFFPIDDTCLSCGDIARRSCAMVPRWRFLVSCIFSKPRTARFRLAILNSH